MPGRRSARPRHRRYNPLRMLSYVLRYQQQHDGRSPSQRRIQRDLQISAPSVVHNMLHKLEQRGLLTITTYGRGHTADLHVTEAGLAAARQWEQQQSGNG